MKINRPLFCATLNYFIVGIRMTFLDRRSEAAAATLLRQDASLLFELLRGAADSWRSAAIGNLINAAILCFIFYGKVSNLWLAAGFLSLTMLAMWRMAIRTQLSASHGEARDLRSILWQSEVVAAALGLWWGGAVFGLLMLATPDQHLILGIIAAGMMSAGTFSFRSLRRAAQLYCSLCGLGGIAAFLILGTLEAYAACGLTICYLFVLTSNIRTMSGNIASRIVHQREAEDAAETIKLLLNDFTEQGSDWLIELDANGVMVSPSPRLAKAAMRCLMKGVNARLLRGISNARTPSAIISCR
jgi:hypothetical protein